MKCRLAKPLLGWMLRAFYLSFSLPLLSGCYGMMLAGDLARYAQKDTDIFVPDGVTLEMLRTKRDIAVNINGINAAGQYVFAVGSGAASNASVYSDMVTKELLKMGITARSVTGEISESSPPETFRDLRSRGHDMVLVGNMAVSTTTSQTAYITGGDAWNTGVTSFTVKGLDVRDGSILFILSADYGKAKDASQVAEDLTTLYQNMLNGSTGEASASASHNQLSPRQTNSAPATSASASLSRDETAGEVDLAWVQRTLNAKGFNCGTADGIMGPQTQACIRAFQRANALQDTGELNPVTITMIRSYE